MGTSFRRESKAASPRRGNTFADPIRPACAATTGWGSARGRTAKPGPRSAGAVFFTTDHGNTFSATAQHFVRRHRRARRHDRDPRTRVHARVAVRCPATADGAERPRTRNCFITTNGGITSAERRPWTRQEGNIQRAGRQSARHPADERRPGQPASRRRRCWWPPDDGVLRLGHGRSGRASGTTCQRILASPSR